MACPQARETLTYYTKAVADWRSKMGIQKSHEVGRFSCAQILRRIPVIKARAIAARKRYDWWWHYAWPAWMPDKWQRIGACETGYGKRPGDFHWNSGTSKSPGYQGFVGFAASTWDAYRPAGYPSEAYDATPREQLVVAEIVRAAVGYGAWGCGGA